MKKNPLNNYVKYSSLAFQMGVTVLGGAWGGTLLDKYFHFTIPIFTLVLSVGSVALAMYLALRDLGSFDKKNKNP